MTRLRSRRRTALDSSPQNNQDVAQLIRERSSLKFVWRTQSPRRPGGSGAICKSILFGLYSAELRRMRENSRNYLSQDTLSSIFISFSGEEVKQIIKSSQNFKLCEGQKVISCVEIKLSPKTMLLIIIDILPLQISKCSFYLLQYLDKYNFKNLRIIVVNSQLLVENNMSIAAIMKFQTQQNQIPFSIFQKSLVIFSLEHKMCNSHKLQQK
ncbi:Hypothetical_protein [Hexamita inflata]|uniref:Hypothetical_protein n=1 Tax=Hexamita inflata TaxID=28002 RepID=A0AA86NJM0_9EUKA|nr:Hypothetical protein HINF_LOCUS7868 [Hexamita inflata]